MRPYRHPLTLMKLARKFQIQKSLRGLFADFVVAAQQDRYRGRGA